MKRERTEQREPRRAWAIAIAFILITAAAPAFAQTGDKNDIKKIRDHYSKVAAEIEKIEKSPDAAIGSELAVNELAVNKLNKSWPAVGTYSVNYRFYYKQVGEEPYPDQLVMVRKTTVSAARKMYEEHLFSENGDLIFSFIRDDEGDEHRLYMKYEALIKYSGKGNGAALATATKAKVKDYVRLFALSIQ